MALILTVDDDSNNLRALRLDLEDAGHRVVEAADGVEALAVLDRQGAEISAILLDRMMPRMDGMEFISHFKQTPYRHKPVIMQTAAAEKEQVVEGIKAGVYYYLTKPYDKEVMLSVVYAAVTNYGHYAQLRADLDNFKKKLHLARESYFEIQKLDDVEYLATFLAQCFPSPVDAVFGLAQLLINAIEHGNLEITYDEKSTLNREGRWLEEIEHRQRLPQYRDRKVLVTYKRTAERVSVTIKDEGKGFDWRPYMDVSPQRAMHSHGRGIALSRMASFDALDYREPGNEVTCSVFL